MKQLFKTFRRNSGSNTLTGLSEKAEGILSKAVELWPMLQRPFAKDPIEDAIETEAGFRGKTVADLQLPVWFIVLVRFYYSLERPVHFLKYSMKYFFQTPKHTVPNHSKSLILQHYISYIYRVEQKYWSIPIYVLNHYFCSTL